MDYHVAKNGSDRADGGADTPLLTISEAAGRAGSGDRIIVHSGEYREWVRPAYGGRSDSERIVYEAAPDEKVVIKGSEKIENWEQVQGSVWRVTVANDLFGDYNPFASHLWGDWLIVPVDRPVHAGDIYLNGRALYVAESLVAVRQPTIRRTGTNPPWTNRREQIPHPEETLCQWYAEVTETETILYANFQDHDPNRELTEISVRKCCFYPARTGIDYLTVRGFEMAQAASPWAPPTAEQPGLLGVNWAKGWIIENNIIHDAKCCGISIGKEYTTGHNDCSAMHRKPGYQYQMEAVFKALQIGWGKERIGSHLIRNNEIYDCGQNGIVGHMGCVFSRIIHNHIHHIGVKHEFFGHEIAGIKLHAAIDVIAEENRIHNCTLGIWLDWQDQGTRISRNLCYENDRDLMIEVTHGPHLVDNNIFASEYNFDNIAQGGAYVHNLFCGTMRREPVLNRTTPYHLPHSTVPMGTAFVFSGDDRWYQNIFLGGQKTYTSQSKAGTEDYNGHPESLEDYVEAVLALGVGDHENFNNTMQPVYIGYNGYLKGAGAYERETEPYISSEDPCIAIRDEGEKVWLDIQVPDGLLHSKGQMISTNTLGMPRIVEERFENPDGSRIVLNRDYLGKSRKDNPYPGPFADLQPGFNEIRVW